MSYHFLSAFHYAIIATIVSEEERRCWSKYSFLHTVLNQINKDKQQAKTQREIAGDNKCNSYKHQRKENTWQGTETKTDCDNKRAFLNSIWCHKITFWSSIWCHSKLYPLKFHVSLETIYIWFLQYLKL